MDVQTINKIDIRWWIAICFGLENNKCTIQAVNIYGNECVKIIKWFRDHITAQDIGPPILSYS